MLFGLVVQALVEGMGARYGGEAVAPSAPDEVDDGLAEELALQVPQSDVDGADGKRCWAALVAIPPGMLVELAPQGDVLHRVCAQQLFAHRFDDPRRGPGGLGELGDGLTPAHRAVVRLYRAKRQEADIVRIVRFRVADVPRLNPAIFILSSLVEAPVNSGPS